MPNVDDYCHYCEMAYGPDRPHTTFLGDDMCEPCKYLQADRYLCGKATNHAPRNASRYRSAIRNGSRLHWCDCGKVKMWLDDAGRRVA